MVLSHGSWCNFGMNRYFPISTFFVFSGQQPEAMQHGGQLRLEYPFRVIIVSILVTLAGL